MAKDFFKGKRVMITGHTGFKGSWLSRMLLARGAEVSGYSLRPNTSPNLFSVLGLEAQVKTYYGDIREFSSVFKAVKAEKPEILFHLAAQPLVRDSYDSPLYTFETNAIGTANVLEAIRKSKCVKAGVMITTDKVYRNREDGRAYVEEDELGGHDPYSSSKACAEMIIQSYARAYFGQKAAAGAPANSALICSARAGNVIGGGDWSKDRLVPDMVRCIYEKGQQVAIRNPGAIRPWQHVLDPIFGYITLAEGLCKGNEEFCGAWNFSPAREDFITVEQLVQKAIRIMGKGSYAVQPDNTKHEMNVLKLDSAKAQSRLGWKPRLGIDRSLEWTFKWYSEYYAGKDMPSFTEKQLEDYRKLVS